MFGFQKNYFFLTIILLCIEVFIAIFIQDGFIRPYLGDVLVVILVYCFVKTILNIPVIPTAAGVLLFAYAIETAQYFNLATLLGMENNRVAKTIIGTSFEWKDMLAYTCGICAVLLMEHIRIKN